MEKEGGTQTKPTFICSEILASHVIVMVRLRVGVVDVNSVGAYVLAHKALV